MISCSLLTGTSKATPSEYQSFMHASSSVSWWMAGVHVVIPVKKQHVLLVRKVSLRLYLRLTKAEITSRTYM